MNATSKHSTPLISRDTPSATSSPELVAGASPSDSPDGPMTDLFGRVVVPVNPSLPPERRKAAVTIDISGRIGRGSSASAALQRSLVNRLRQQWPTGGSMLFSMRWKPVVTVAGRSVSRLQVSALRTGDNGYGSWATPTTRDHKDGNAASCQNVPINCLLGRQVHLSGSPAKTASSDQLNPAFSLWLQGYPTAWGRCAVRVMPSSRKSRRHLSPPIKR